MSSRYFEAYGHVKLYAQFRPVAPRYLIKKIIEHVNKTIGGSLDFAVDVGCGSGQSTQGLAEYFNNVTGVDVSEAQVNAAIKSNNLKHLKFLVSPAEKLPFSSSSVQLVTVGQACHWFDMPAFFKECDRILSPGGVLAMYTYDFPRPMYGDVSDQLFALVNNMYFKHTAKYFGKERKYVDDRLTDEKFKIPYSDFRRIENINMEKTTTVAELVGYISSWSGFQAYQKDKGEEAGEKLLSTFLSDTMKLLDVETPPEETKLIINHPYTCLLGSKPK